MMVLENLPVIGNFKDEIYFIYVSSAITKFFFRTYV